MKTLELKSWNNDSTKTVSYNEKTMRVETSTNSATFIKLHSNGMATISTQGASCKLTTKRYLVK